MHNIKVKFLNSLGHRVGVLTVPDANFNNRTSHRACEPQWESHLIYGADNMGKNIGLFVHGNVYPKRQDSVRLKLQTSDVKSTRVFR